MEENQILNTPLKNDAAMTQENRKFLSLLIKLIEDEKIELHTPDTLLNHEVYDKLDELKQGQVDLAAVNLLAVIREIKDLYDAGFIETFQMENLVHRLKETKESIEESGGDLFLI